MLVLGLQGSPRKGGNTDILLSSFIEEAAGRGADVLVFNPSEMRIEPCRGCRFCERNGFCVIDGDDMSRVVYPALRKADLIVMASPVFFYSVPSQLKALIDRCQALWAGKYLLKLSDPGSKWRKGFLLSAGARKDEHLFDGINLTAKYFFGTISAPYTGSLVYNQIENIGDIQNHSSAIDDIRRKAAELVEPLLKRKRIIFVCSGNAGRSQMSAAFAQIYAGDRFEFLSGGSKPASEVSRLMTEVMAEKGIDMAFRKPVSLEAAMGRGKADYAVTMGCEVSCPVLPGAEIIEWDLPDPKGQPIDFMRGLRDEIQKNVMDLISKL